MTQQQEDMIRSRKLARLRALADKHGGNSAEVRAWLRLYPEYQQEARERLARLV